MVNILWLIITACTVVIFRFNQHEQVNFEVNSIQAGWQSQQILKQIPKMATPHSVFQIMSWGSGDTHSFAECKVYLFVLVDED